jgi:hypothetical protein
MELYFGDTIKKSIQVLRLQNKVIRLNTGTYSRNSCRPIFRKFKTLTLVSLYISEIVCFLKKYQRNMKYNSETHDYNMRNRHDLHTQHCNTVLYQRSVTNMGIKLFNKLPARIKQINRYSTFKKAVKSLLIYHTFYTIEEYLQADGL